MMGLGMDVLNIKVVSPERVPVMTLVLGSNVYMYMTNYVTFQRVLTRPR